MDKTGKVALAGAALAAVESGRIFYLVAADRDLKWTLFAGAYLAGALACGAGLWKRRAWALSLSYLLAAAAFGFGCYLVHFRWTFWLFKTPTLWDRIAAAAHPLGLLYLAGPVFWLAYFSRRDARQSFK